MFNFFQDPVFIIYLSELIFSRSSAFKWSKHRNKMLYNDKNLPPTLLPQSHSMKTNVNF